MTGDTSIVAVLSGDLIGSSEAPPKDTEYAIKRILATAAAMEKWPGNGPTRFTRVRGDGWQFILSNPAYALRASLSVFAGLIGAKDLLHTRIAIGLGAANPIDGPDLSSASGAAFESSGHALDAMATSDRFAIAGKAVSPLHRAIIALAENHIGRWTPEQAEAAFFYLNTTDPTLKDIGQTLGISTQAAHSRVTGAGGQALRQAVKYWEDQRDLVPC